MILERAVHDSVPFALTFRKHNFAPVIPRFSGGAGMLLPGEGLDPKVEPEWACQAQRSLFLGLLFGWTRFSEGPESGVSHRGPDPLKGDGKQTGCIRLTSIVCLSTTIKAA